MQAACLVLEELWAGDDEGEGPGAVEVEGEAVEVGERAHARVELLGCRHPQVRGAQRAAGSARPLGNHLAALARPTSDTALRGARFVLPPRSCLLPARILRRVSFRGPRLL